MGKHGSTLHPAKLIGAGIVLVTLAAATAIALTGADRQDEPGADSAETANCARSLSVLTASSFAPALAELAPTLGNGPDCVSLAVAVADGRSAAAVLASSKPDVWIPDDMAWTAFADDKVLAERGTAGAGTVLAVSPIYMVTDPDSAIRIRKAGGSWLGLANLLAGGSGLRLVVPEPSGSGDGMVAAGDLGEAVWLKDGMDASAMALHRALRVTRTVPRAGAALRTRRGEVGLVPEYALLASDTKPGPSTVVLAGRDYAGLLRFSWQPTAAAAKDPGRAEAMRRVLEALTGAGAARALDVANLRRPDSAKPPTGGPDGLPQLAERSIPVLKPHHVDHLFTTFYRQDRRTNLLLVIDVSGSMGAIAPGSRTPLINLVRQGSVSVGRLLPDDAAIGLWEFGSRLDPPRDYRVLLPADRMGGARRQALDAAAAKLAPRNTGTGLYDTILGAYRAATKAYRPGMPNQVMVFTDGRNEDDPASISLPQLTTALKAATDKKRQVHLSVAAYGAQPEADALEKALEPVGGYVEVVRSAAQVEAAFMHVAAGGLHEE